MKRRDLIALFVCVATLASPAFARTPHVDGASIAAKAADAATQLQTYLAGVDKTSDRPDFSKPPAADLLDQVFNLKQLEALPPAQGDDLMWLPDWIDAANTANKAIMFFGITPPVTPMVDGAAIQRNVIEFEDQVAIAANFLVRGTAYEIQAALVFLDQLPPAQRTPVRMEGFHKMRIADAEYVRDYLACIAPAMKPANSRLISAAFRDTGAVWASAVLPADRPGILILLGKARDGVKDEETRDNLSAFVAQLAKAD